MSKGYVDQSILNTLKYLVFLALFVLFFVVFIHLAKSNFRVSQKEVNLKIDLQNKINLCVPDEKNQKIKS
ncbi:hypothetical protein LBMAG18_06000 [Alphaproteobacteria bacterium]|nr:hypothetical protein LBMAG18_06000 [Alphaproteobacteria bacterium]